MVGGCMDRNTLYYHCRDRWIISRSGSRFSDLVGQVIATKQINGTYFSISHATQKNRLQRLFHLFSLLTDSRFVFHLLRHYNVMVPYITSSHDPELRKL